MRDLDLELRRRAVRHGAIMTSVALAIAIFTDVIGFLSFRLSSLVFLQVFGTVIAIGLLMIYLLSISALPALMLTLPPKRMALEKAVKTEPPLVKALARLSDDPLKVAGIAVLLLCPWASASCNSKWPSTNGNNSTPKCPSLRISSCFRTNLRRVLRQSTSWLKAPCSAMKAGLHGTPRLPWWKPRTARQ